MNSPAEIAKVYSDIGAGKTRISSSKLFLLGVMAGAFIALGAFGSSVASCLVEPLAVGRVLSALVFPIGLMMVLCAGAELFTGNCLIILSVLDKKTTIKGMLRNWLLVYLGNFVGGVFIALLIVASGSMGLYSGALAEATVKTATAKATIPFSDALLKGILCNFMVCIAVWCAFGASDLWSKIIGSYMPIFLFVLSGFEHCVANMYFVPAGIFASIRYGFPAQGLSWLNFVIRNLVPVTMGNIIGGAIMIGALYWYVYMEGNSRK